MMISGRYTLLACVLLLVTPLVVTTCSEKITDVNKGKIELKIDASIDGITDASQAVTFVLTVTGVGIAEPITELLLYENGLLTGSVVVPAGPRRLFRIEALDEAGVVMYAGQTVADVETASVMELKINLYPEVPMMKISPAYTQKPQGTLLTMKIKIYNVENLNTVEGILDNYGEISQRYFSVDSVVLDPGIADFARLTWWDTYASVQFKVEHTDPNGRLVDDSGYAALLTAYYKTYMSEVFPPVETFRFNPSILSLRDMEGNVLPPDAVYTEEAVAELYDYTMRRVAYYHMGWGTGSEDKSWVEDRSGNGLHGNATGTTFVYGVFGDARLFNGNGDFIEVPDNDLLDIDEAITISLWFYVDRAVGAFQPVNCSLISKMSRNGPINYQLIIEDASATDGYASILFRYGGAVHHTYRVDVTDKLMTGWRHVIFSYEFGNPSSALMVLDLGNLESMEGSWIVGNGSGRAPVTSESLLIARDNAATPVYFRGRIDEVELFNAAFDFESIKYLYTYYWKR